MELKCLLMWLLFGFIKRNKPEECPPLPGIEFADVTAEAYPVGTELYYDCEKGYTRRSGQYSGIQCQSVEQGTSWAYEKFECIDEKMLSAMAPMMDLDFIQKPEGKTESPALQKQENLPEFDQEGFCGPPKTIPHAFLDQNGQYQVGQVLYFKCQSGYTKQSPTSGTRTCKKENGIIAWTDLDMRCTNSSDMGPPQRVQKGLTQPSSSSAVSLPLTAIFFGLLIIPAVFV